jgi:hypothetical protein
MAKVWAKKVHCVVLTSSKKGLLEVQEIWSLLKYQEIIIFHEGGEITGAYSIY